MVMNAVTATLIVGIIAAIPPTALLLYKIDTDSTSVIRRKASSIKKLDPNTEMLDRELQKLLALPTDID